MFEHLPQVRKVDTPSKAYYILYKTSQPPKVPCHVYNIFYPMDSSAARIEPLFKRDYPPEPLVLNRFDLCQRNSFDRKKKINFFRFCWKTFKKPKSLRLYATLPWSCSICSFCTSFIVLCMLGVDRHCLANNKRYFSVFWSKIMNF